jgi:hypothetical protein
MDPIPNNDDDTLRPEYDLKELRGGVRGKHLAAYQAGTNLVRLSPDVAAAFPTSDAVNQALRMLLQLARQHVSTTSN